MAKTRNELAIIEATQRTLKGDAVMAVYKALAAYKGRIYIDLAPEDPDATLERKSISEPSAFIDTRRNERYIDVTTFETRYRLHVEVEVIDNDVPDRDRIRLERRAMKIANAG